MRIFYIQLLIYIEFEIPVIRMMWEDETAVLALEYSKEMRH